MKKDTKKNKKISFENYSQIRVGNIPEIVSSNSF